MKILSYAFLLFVIFLGVTFACLNADPVAINYYLGTAKVPLSLLLAFVFTLGGLAGLLVSLKMLLKIKYYQVKLKQRVKIAEKEIENLRAIPVKDSH